METDYVRWFFFFLRNKEWLGKMEGEVNSYYVTSSREGNCHTNDHIMTIL